MDNPFEAPKPNSTKVATKWAFINLAVSVVLTLTFQYLNIAQDSAARYLAFLPFIGFLILTQTEFKAQLGGSMTYGQGFSAGFRFALFSGILGAIFMFIYVSYIYPGFITQAMDLQRAKMETQGLSDDQVEKAMAMSSKFMGPVMFSFFAAVGSAFTGTIISLITAAIVKKDPQPFDASAYQDPTV